MRLCNTLKKHGDVSLMKKVVLFFTFLLFFVSSVFAQFDSQISHYTFFPASINPAMVGETGMIQIIGFQRINYIGMNGGQVTNFGVNSPLRIKGTNHGLGLRFVIAEQGELYSNQNAYIQYAYKHKTSIGTFGVGVDIGFLSVGFDGTKVEMPELGEYHDSSDSKIPSGKVSGTGFDLNVGALYSFKKGFVGVSYAHVNKLSVSWDDKNTINFPGILYVMGTYGFDIPDTKLVFRPNTLLKTDFAAVDWDLGARLEYNEKLWGGLSYRIGNAVVFMVGVNIFGGLSASVAYDLPASKMILGTFGSFELLLEYNFEFLFNKQTKKYKSVRIL